MKINCLVSDFLSIIEPACYVASKSSIKTNPFNDQISIKTENNMIEMLSFNGSVSIFTKIEDVSLEYNNMKISGSGNITVSSVNLMKNVSSFNEEETIEVELFDDKGQKELRISKVSDKEEFQSIPCLSSNIFIPDNSNVDMSKEINIDRSVFLECANKINFALGFENEFLYWVMRVAGEKIRFASGDNRRFAILDAAGSEIVKSNSKTSNIMFPKEHSAILLKLLSKSNSSKFTIKEYKKTNLHYQSISFDNHVLIFYHIDPNVQWPDENKVLKKEIKTKFVVSAKDWETVAKAVDAAFDGAEIDENKFEVVSLRTDFKEKVLHVEVNENHKISRKVPLLDYFAESGEDISFKVNALYLKEIFLKGEKDGKYQFDFGGLIEDSLGNKFVGPFFVIYYASEKVKDSKEIIRVDSGTKWIYKFLFIILPTK